MIKLDNKKSIDITIIGRVTIDFNPQDYYKTLDKNQLFSRFLGGSAGNICVGLAKYQKKVNFISRVSCDQFAIFIKNYLKNLKISLDSIQEDPKLKTGLTFTEMLSEHKSTILMYRQKVADLNIDPLLIDVDKIKNSKMVLISGSSLSQSPSREGCLRVLYLGLLNQAIIIFDCDYRPYNWKSELETSIYYYNIAINADIIIGSKEEIEFFFKFWNQDNLSSEDYARHFLQRKTKIVVIKNGKDGAEAYTSNKKYHVPIIPVKMIKGFGGGDAWASTFIWSLLENENLKLALARSSAAASIVVSQLSSSDSLPTKEELFAFMETNNFSENNIKVTDFKLN